MAISVNTIPSVNIPFTDQNGRINPIWHEFLRSFVAASVDGTVSEESATTSVTAGAGLTGGGVGDVTLNVGAGSGITVNANDVNVDISGQSRIQVALDDEVMVSDISDNNNIRKARVRDLAALAGAEPGGSDNQVQYNDNGVFNGDSGFTYDGAGIADLSSGLYIGSISIDGGAVNTIIFDSGTVAGNSPRIQSNGATGYTLYGALPGGWSNNATVAFNSAGPPWITYTFNTNNTITMNNSDGTGTGISLNGKMALGRCMHENITASTTQTQGNGALTGDYNNVTTVANDNDTVTLPAAFRSRYCVVRNAGANILQIFPASGDNLGAGVDTAVTLRPGAHYSWFAIDTTTWHPLDGTFRLTTASGITASTTQTQGQQPLTKDVNEISTVANANDVVTLPSAPSYSRTVTIINNGANILQIFPASGDNLGAGVDTSTTLAAGSNVRYTNYNATNWEAI